MLQLNQINLFLWLVLSPYFFRHFISALNEILLLPWAMDVHGILALFYSYVFYVYLGNWIKRREKVGGRWWERLV